MNCNSTDLAVAFAKTDVHSYENFLALHDPELRRSLGIFYTPQPAVNYIVRAVDDILKEDFDLPGGIADKTKIDFDGQTVHKVQILDPATGVGTFLFEVIEQIHRRIKGKYGLAAWKRYVPEHLLPRLHGFEIMETPYSIAQLKLAEWLHGTGYPLSEHQRFSIHLTNALEPQEQYEHVPIMVVLGNPPYNVSTMNKSQFSNELIAKYKIGEGVENERNIQPLSDDYIKFIALGQHFIETNPEKCGILAYISNNSFLDGLIHRQMRKSLLGTFDVIYILNLHGNVRKKEKTPDGGKDENVFNIQVGTSINTIVKWPAHRTTDKPAKVYYADLFGTRQEKYNFLSSRRLKTSGFNEITPVAPNYFFIEKDFSGKQDYDKGFSIPKLFLKYNSGIKTHCDAVTIQFSSKEMQSVRNDLHRLEIDDFVRKYRLKENSKDWTVQKAKRDINRNQPSLTKIVYRPFDTRWTLYTGETGGFLVRPRTDVMQHIIDKENLCLIVSRQVNLAKWNHVYIANSIVECCVNFCGAGMPIVAPLYLYPPQEERRPNFNQVIVAKIEQIIGKKIKPEKLFDYIYAVLHSPKYRKNYEEFLKIDFPKIPYPVDNTEFERFVKYGQRLRKLHLLEKIPKIKTTVPIADGNVVENVRFVDGKVFINKTQYFDNVPASVWEFYVGGYQPLQKYLKDRKGRVLTFEEIQHYQKIAAVLSETETIMKELCR